MLYWLLVCFLLFAVELRLGLMSWWLIDTTKRTWATWIVNALVLAAIISIMPVVALLQFVQYSEKTC